MTWTSFTPIGNSRAVVVSLVHTFLLSCCILALTAVASAQRGKVFINPNYPIKGEHGANLSPPHVEQTNECAKSVWVDSFVPGAEITVFKGGATLIGGPFPTQFGFADVPVTAALTTGESITTKQTVNGVTSAASLPMIVGAMPSTLPAPTIDPNIFACGHIAPVHNLVSGVSVKITDLTTGTSIGSGATPNLWGSDWDPVGTSSLVAAHEITARQSSCTGHISPAAAIVKVKPDPAPIPSPVLDTPIVGNDAITAHDLDIGSLLQAFDHTTSIGSGFSTAETNWMKVAPIAASASISAQQGLCTQSPKSPPQTPTTTIPAPVLVGPICPHAVAAIVSDTTINGTLVLLKNGVISGYGGAAPGDVPLDIAPPAVFAQNDKVQVVEYINNLVAFSNEVTVGCTNITTYHNDNQRTGWNPHENTLTPANVNALDFGLVPLAQNPVPLDDQVDAQPLIVTNQNIAGQGVHTVVYVVTENNSVYAIDSWSGQVLKHVNLGTPVSQSALPGGCGNNGPNVGINSTPTVDARTQTLYVIDFVMVGGNPTHRLHALDLSTLNDKPGSPNTISASHTLTDGSTYNWKAIDHRQRSALLQANGNIYGGFASFCDIHADKSRGWLLGWNQTSLAELSANQLNDRDVTASPFYLSSIWMSGYGLAADSGGDLFFVTGNSDPNKDTYTGGSNIQESVVRLSPDLTTIKDLFTPCNIFNQCGTFSSQKLDPEDLDYGSGGALVLPDQPGPVPHLTVAAGKVGQMFIINRDNMGKLHNPDIPSFVSIRGGSGSQTESDCHCGPSYFEGSDKIGRVVSSGDNFLHTWKVDTTQTPALISEASATLNPDWGADGGFFTSISSNGMAASTQIIWALGCPTGSKNALTLYAFNGTASGSSLSLLWTGTAGTWPNTGGNANLVPTIGNGRVYVASYKSLAIFGLRPAKRRGRFAPRLSAQTEALFQQAPPPLKLFGPQFWGTVRNIDGNEITLELRTGEMLKVDLTTALKNESSVMPVVGSRVVVNGTMNEKGVMEAETMLHAKGPSLWGPDSPR